MTHAAISDLPVLLVDDEPDLLYSVSVLLRTSGLTHVVTLDDSRAVLPLLAERDVGVIVLDLTMPHLCGQALLERVAADHPDVPVILLTATSDLETAVQCMQAGALDYLVKPVEESRLLSSVKRALEIRAMRTELLVLKQCVLTDARHQREAFADIVTRDKAMGAVFRYVEAVAPSPYPVLITGETGTGKELVARALHRLSARTGEFVAVNVAGLDDTMFSDTLLGHTKGAYTGADRPREGLITTRGGGHALPRRDRRPRDGLASQIVAPAPGWRVSPPRRGPPAAESRTHRRCDQLRRAPGRECRDLPQGLVL